MRSREGEVEGVGFRGREEWRGGALNDMAAGIGDGKGVRWKGELERECEWTRGRAR